MKRWPIEFFEEEGGEWPVPIWLDGLPEQVRGKVLARIDLLAQHGPILDHAFTAEIEGQAKGSAAQVREGPISRPRASLMRPECVSYSMASPDMRRP